jgi:hypothetical protein
VMANPSTCRYHSGRLSATQETCTVQRLILGASIPGDHCAICPNETGTVATGHECRVEVT